MDPATGGSASQWEYSGERSTVVAQSQAVDFVNLSAFTLVVFDYLVTFDREVKLAWRREVSWAKRLFFLNRYLAILLFFLSLGPLIPTRNTLSCRALNYSTQAVTVLLYAVWAAFSGARIYAISNRNRGITWLVAVIGAVPAIIGIFLAARVADGFSPTYGCLTKRTITQNTWLKLAVVTRACFLLSESIVIVVTWMQTRHTVQAALGLGIEMPFTLLVCREGFVYFVAMALLNATAVVADFAARPSLDVECLSSLLNAVVALIVSRFYFHLDALKMVAAAGTSTAEFHHEGASRASASAGSGSAVFVHPPSLLSPATSEGSRVPGSGLGADGLVLVIRGSRSFFTILSDMDAPKRATSDPGERARHARTHMPLPPVPRRTV